MKQRATLVFLTYLAAAGVPHGEAASAQPWTTLPASPTGLCGTLTNPEFGPFDYRTASVEEKRLVEGAHFPPVVETLRRGHRGYLAGDIDYTLRAFPNHPRALHAMARLAKRDGKLKPPGATYPVECYFDRALRFRPDDPWPRVLYVHFLIESKRIKEAEIQIQEISEPLPEDSQLIYNLGLAYFSLHEYETSLALAKRAYALGVQVQGLKNMLKAKGAWRE